MGWLFSLRLFSKGIDKIGKNEVANAGNKFHCIWAEWAENFNTPGLNIKAAELFQPLCKEFKVFKRLYSNYLKGLS